MQKTGESLRVWNLTPWEKVSTQLDALTKTMSEGRTGDNAIYTALTKEVGEIQKTVKKVGDIEAGVKTCEEKIAKADVNLKNAVKNQSFTNKQVEDMIDASNRVSTTADKEIVEGAAQFTALLQGRSNSPDPIEAVDPRYYKHYRDAYAGWLRAYSPNGHEGMKIQAAMQRGIDPEGGYLAPVEMTNQIIRLSEEINPITKYAKIIKTNSAALSGFINTGPPDCQWGAEAEALTETTTPTYGKWRIDVKKLYAYPRMTPEMVADSSIDIEKEVSTQIGTETAKRIGVGSLDGKGERDIRGFYSYGFGLTKPTGADWQHWRYVKSGVADGMDSFDPLIRLRGALDAEYKKTSLKTAFFMNSNTFVHLQTMKDGIGNYMATPHITLTPSTKLMNDPIIIFEGLQDLGDKHISDLVRHLSASLFALDA